MFGEGDGDDDGNTVFRDVVFLALAGFVFIAILLLPHINVKGKQAEKTVDPPGDVIVEATWDAKLSDDVDLWVKAPNDTPVGYSNKGGLHFNLLRDDLGHVGDPSGINAEMAYTRGTPAGEYIVNVHLYRHTSDRLPVKIAVTARVRRPGGQGTEIIATTAVALRREGHEETAFRFRIDDDGQLVPGSVSTLFKALRSAHAGGGQSP